MKLVITYQLLTVSLQNENVTYVQVIIHFIIKTMYLPALSTVVFTDIYLWNNMLGR